MSLTPRARFLLPSRVHVRVVLLAVLAAVLLGTAMFHLLEGWSILDSLYVTAQTVTTVGYGDVTPQRIEGRIVAAVIMLEGVAFLSIVIAAIIATIVAAPVFVAAIVTATIVVAAILVLTAGLHDLLHLRGSRLATDKQNLVDVRS